MNSDTFLSTTFFLGYNENNYYWVTANTAVTVSPNKVGNAIDDWLLLPPPPLDLSFWSYLTFLHHGIEEVERYLL